MELDRLLAQLESDPGDKSVERSIVLTIQAGDLAQHSSLNRRMRERIIKELDHPDHRIRMICVDLVGFLVQKGHYKELTRLKNVLESDPNRRVRLAAYWVLDEHGEAALLKHRLPILDRFSLALTDARIRLFTRSSTAGKRSGDRLTLHYSRKEFISYCFVSCLAIGFFLWLSIEVGIQECFSGVVLWALLLITMLVKAITVRETESRIVVDLEGITNMQWKWKTIPWEDIAAVQIDEARARYFKYRVLSIYLKNPGKYVPQMPLIERVMWKPSHWLDRGHLGFNTFGLDGDLDDVWNHISKLKATGRITVTLKGS